MESPATRPTGSPIPFAVAVSRQELSMPPTITLEQMKGFSLFMLKVVLSGCGDEIIWQEQSDNSPQTHIPLRHKRPCTMIETLGGHLPANEEVDRGKAKT